jgi:hypothetical protein
MAWNPKESEVLEVRRSHVVIRTGDKFYEVPIERVDHDFIKKPIPDAIHGGIIRY